RRSGPLPAHAAAPAVTTEPLRKSRRLIVLSPSSWFGRPSGGLLVGTVRQGGSVCNRPGNRQLTGAENRFHFEPRKHSGTLAVAFLPRSHYSPLVRKIPIFPSRKSLSRARGPPLAHQSQGRQRQHPLLPRHECHGSATCPLRACPVRRGPRPAGHTPVSD